MIPQRSAWPLLSFTIETNKSFKIGHTDIVLQQGLLPIVEFPAIFGHEGAGIIRAIGNKVKNKSLQPGDSVLLSFTTCGVCSACIGSHPAFCHSHATVNHNAVRISDRTTPARLPTGESVRSQYFGQSSFSKLSVVNEKCVVKCSHPDKMEVYAPIGCGIQTGAGTVLNVLKPRKDESVVIFGIGSVGLAAVMAAKYLDVGMIVAVDLVPSRLELARELGATHVINSKEIDAVTGIKEITEGGANYAIDCTGIIKVIEDIVEAIGPEGTAAVVGVPPAEKKISIDPLSFLLANKKLVGVIEGDSNPEVFVPRLIEMHQEGKFPIEKLSVVYPVERFEDAIHDMHSGKVCQKSCPLQNNEILKFLILGYQTGN